jgi:hypothetical protein
MASKDGRRTVTDVFRGVVQGIASLNADARRRARVLHALSNSYEKQIERIECFISEKVEERRRDIPQDSATSQLARASQH